MSSTQGNTAKNAGPSGKSQSKGTPEEDYFALNPAPAGLSAHLESAKTFIKRHQAGARPVALITSGGTTVPLENQTVRFIDNFSAGTRGAASAEYFLRNGYAVLFLHREFSLLPFARHYSHSRNCFLDLLTSPPKGDSTEDDDTKEAVAWDGGSNISIKEEYVHKMRKVLGDYNACKEQGTLLQIPFVTITEYLWLLREVAKLMQPLGGRGLFYLAAAVSDFFVPAQRMVEHKIQSGSEWQSVAAEGEEEQAAAKMQDSRLVIDLDPVPKFLRSLVDSWAPEGMIVSFKLETDPSILTSKAASALRKYSHHLVIGNLLKTRRWEVVFVYNADEIGFSDDADQDESAGGTDGGVVNGSGDIGERWVRVPRLSRVASAGGAQHLVGTAQQPRNEAVLEGQEHKSHEDEGEPIVEIESLLIPEIKRLHEAFIENKKNRR